MDSTHPSVGPAPEILLARWRDDGDAVALGALFDRTAPDLFRIALSVAPDPASAEDALQETFLALMNAAPRVDLSRPLLPFLVGILRHKVEKARARVRRIPDPARLPDPELRVEDPVRAAERSEESGRVRSAILGLPEAYRKAALLRWSHGLEPAEIAEILGKPPGTVWSLLSRAREKLRRALSGVPVVLATGARPPRGLGQVRDAVMAEGSSPRGPGGVVGGVSGTGGALVLRGAAAAAVLLLVVVAGFRLLAPPDRDGKEEAGGATPGVASGKPRERPPASPLPDSGSEGGADGETIDAEPGVEGKLLPSDSVPPAPGLHSGGVFGRVVDGERRPASGATVTLRLGDRLLGEVTADADGQFLVPPAPMEPWPVGEGRHFRYSLLAVDGSGRAARAQMMTTMTLDPWDLEAGATVLTPDFFMGTMTLRVASPLEVRVTAGGAPVDGALVLAQGSAGLEGTEEVRTDMEGRARIEAVPSGRWVLRARRPGRGSGSVVVELPSEAPVEIPIKSRSLELLAVDAATGSPLEGARFLVQHLPPGSEGREWTAGFPPLLSPPTDTSGRALLEDAGEGPLRLLFASAGTEDPAPGAGPVDVSSNDTLVICAVAPGREYRWPAAFGDRDPPPEGAPLTVALADRAMDGLLLLRYEETREGRIEGGAVTIRGPESGILGGVARAPDGSLARLEAPDGSGHLPPARFFAPRRLTVTVRDEDDLPVPNLVALLSPGGVSFAHPEWVDEEGRVTFDGLLPGTVVVCALARTQWGGAEVASVDMAAGDRRVEVVVGREFPLVIRVRTGGKPGLPGEYGIRMLTPGPPGLGERHFEDPSEVEEDPERGEVRLRVRPHAPGAAVRFAMRAGTGAWIEGSVLPPKQGEAAEVDVDL